MFGYFAEKLNVKNLGELLAPTLTPEQEFHAAIEQGLHDKFVRMLDELNIDPNAKNDAGNLPIHTAAYYGRVDFIELLLTRNVDVNALCSRENSPLHYAAAQSRDEAVKFLVNHGANPALRNRSGRTPYDVAKGDNIRQYLLPLQFRHEDPAQAATMLPPGITPSVDPMAPRPVIAPPPLSGDYAAPQGPPIGMPQQQTPQNNLYAAATHSAIPRGGPSRVARPKDYRPIQADGFGSSVGNEELTAKFGNKQSTAAPPAPGVNPYASTSWAASVQDLQPKLAAGADANTNAAPAAAPAPVAHQPPAFGAAAPQYAPQHGAPQYDAPAQDEEVNLSANATSDAHEIMSVEQETTKALESLSFEELSLLNERKEALKKDHAAYVEAHPEIKTLLSGFMSALLLEKPQDVVAFAAEHFSAFKPPHTELEPIVIAGPSGVGKGEGAEGDRGGLFLEHAEVHANVYGTSKRAVQDVQEKGKICILDIDIQGVQQVKKSGIRAKYLFIAPPSMEELEKRLRGRATETEDKIQLRVKNAAGELEYGQQPGVFDAILVNKVVDDSFRELVATLKQWYPTVELK
ncbi:serine/threonine-protein kinase drkB [Phytophthora nicotianae]|uniref:Serine/threonine-protein kinase drkB n=1 Tax=Phytophthora nicotianae TaxID=4792 RepID=A0A0W8DEV6_PHYNI|nr:serine/threonine-protein kinase drkB [Phytophthora nicotianae]